jgi:WD40 repeat protein
MEERSAQRRVTLIGCGALCCFVWVSLVVSSYGQSGRATLLYISSFKSGKLLTFDLEARKVVRTIAVNDGSGTIAVAVTASDKKLVVVDGDSTSRLRVFDASAGRQIQEHAFKDRVLQLGSRPVMHLTADDRWLLLSTYNYEAAASGVRIFDMKMNTFVPTGLRTRACASPEFSSARDGTVVAVCPNLIQTLKWTPEPREFFPGPQIPTPLARWSDTAFAAILNRLYLLEYVSRGNPWRVAAWQNGSPDVKVQDLRSLLEGGTTSDDHGGQAWLDVSPDGKTIGLVYETHVWILDPDTLKPLRTVSLPRTAERAAFTMDGRYLLTFTADAEGTSAPRPALLKVSVDSGSVETTPLDGVGLSINVTVFKTGPQP